MRVCVARASTFPPGFAFDRENRATEALKADIVRTSMCPPWRPARSPVLPSSRLPSPRRRLNACSCCSRSFPPCAAPRVRCPPRQDLATWNAVFGTDNKEAYKEIYSCAQASPSPNMWVNAPNCLSVPQNFPSRLPLPGRFRPFLLPASRSRYFKRPEAEKVIPTGVGWEQFIAAFVLGGADQSSITLPPCSMMMQATPTLRIDRMRSHSWSEIYPAG